MSPKQFLVGMTAVAVVADSLLHPFYPQYFAEVFGVRSPQHVGWYIAACSFTVLASLPAWALVARRIPTLHVLIGTQIATCALALLCYQVTSLTWFWVTSLAMMAFKASYLLIYPYVMSLETPESRPQTIGLLAFIVYFGNLLAALTSGVVFEHVNPRALFLLMAAGDVAQTALCLLLLRSPIQARLRTDAPRREESGLLVVAAAQPQRSVMRLGAVMLLAYFSAYLTEPFFASHWESVSGSPSRLLAGCVFAVPAVTALFGLWLDHVRPNSSRSPRREIALGLGLALVSLWLQASSNGWLLVAGRCLYGWALYVAMVQLDAFFFEGSAPEDFAVDFSRINLFQGLGVLLASTVAGTAVAQVGIPATFLLASVGFALSLLLYNVLFRSRPIAAELPVASGPQEVLR